MLLCAFLKCFYREGNNIRLYLNAQSSHITGRCRALSDAKRCDILEGCTVLLYMAQFVTPFLEALGTKGAAEGFCPTCFWCLPWLCDGRALGTPRKGPAQRLKGAVQPKFVHCIVWRLHLVKRHFLFFSWDGWSQECKCMSGRTGLVLSEGASHLHPSVAPISSATSHTYENRTIHFLILKSYLAAGISHICKLKWPYSVDEKNDLDA